LEPIFFLPRRRLGEGGSHLCVSVAKPSAPHKMKNYQTNPFTPLHFAAHPFFAKAAVRHRGSLSTLEILLPNWTEARHEVAHELLFQLKAPSGRNANSITTNTGNAGLTDIHG
jgi:hypothetical protein